MIYDKPLANDPTEIKVALLRTKKSQSQIARKLGVSVVTVHLTIEGRRKGARVRKAIARALGKKVIDLWPPKDCQKAA